VSRAHRTVAVGASFFSWKEGQRILNNNVHCHPDQRERTNKKCFFTRLTIKPEKQINIQKKYLNFKNLSQAG